MKRTISAKDLVIEYQKYYLKPHWQRFGQMMFNKYFAHTGDWPELYYEEDIDKAFALIANNCLEIDDESRN